MSVKDIGGIVKTLEAAGIDSEMIGQIQFALDFEATVTSLEARLRGGYQFQEIIMDALKTTMDFYDADSALVVSLDMDLLIAKAEYEAHREGFMPVCGTEPLYLTDYPEIMEVLHHVASKMEAFPFTEVFTLLAKGSKSYQRLEQIGIQSIMAVPYSKRNTGFVAVINPRKYKDRPDENELLQVLSYVTVAEINEMNLMNYQRNSFFDSDDLAPNDVYVKLLDGFELRTREGIIREKDLRSNLSVLFLTHLLLKKGASISEKTLLEALWEKPRELAAPEKTLKNLSYSTKRKIIHLFPSNGFLEIRRTAYGIGRKYNVITDLDWFGYKVRDIQGIHDEKARLEQYMNLLDDFNGMVLPNLDHRSLKAIDTLYDERREEVQLEALALMYKLGQYSEMHGFINRINLRKGFREPFVYWEIKSDIGMSRRDMANKLFQEKEDILTAEHKSELIGLLTAV